MALFKKELISKIRTDFSLNIYETKVWLALLSKGIASAGEIAEISDVPRSRTYDVLESLEKQGFAIQKLGKPIKYIAVKPKIIIEKLKKNLVRDAESRVEVLAKVKDTPEFNELVTLHKQGIQPVKRENLSGAIKGRNDIYDYLREIIESAEKEVQMATTSEALERKMSFLKPAIKKLKKNRISIKIMASGDSEDLRKISKELEVPIKKTSIKSRFYVIDGNQILFMITPDLGKKDDIGIWINSPYFSKALSVLFNYAYIGR